jgi:hypothetical protein
MALLMARVLFFAGMLWIAIQGIRSQGLEGRLSCLARIDAQVTLSQLATVLRAPAGVLLLLLRSVKTQRELALEVKQAQQVQQVILPQ